MAAIQTNFPDSKPSLNLNFTKVKVLDPCITFTRASIATYYGSDDLLKSAASEIFPTAHRLSNTQLQALTG